LTHSPIFLGAELPTDSLVPAATIPSCLSRCPAADGEVGHSLLLTHRAPVGQPDLDAGDAHVPPSPVGVDLPLAGYVTTVADL
jgi:hypothetical protein